MTCVCVFTYTRDKIIHKYAASSSSIDQKNDTLETFSYDVQNIFEFIKELYFIIFFASHLVTVINDTVSLI